MASPIKPSILVHLATIYNVYRDQQTGKLTYFRTYLDRVRVMTKSTAVQTAVEGWTRTVMTSLLVDPKTTQAYTRDAKGQKVKKTYLSWPEWDKAADKNLYWTLRDGSDWLLVDTERKTERSELPADANDMAELNALKIQKIEPTLNKDGKTHHWELHLV